MKPLRTGQKIYVACSIVTELGVEIVPNLQHIVGFSNVVKIDWLDGQIGALPVFTNKHKALKYSKSILTFTVRE